METRTMERGKKKRVIFLRCTEHKNKKKNSNKKKLFDLAKENIFTRARHDNDDECIFTCCPNKLL